MKILVVEDEPQMLATIVQALERENYIVESAPDFHSAMEKTETFEYDCILLDISLPGGSGLKILEQLKKDHKGEGVIIISAKNSTDDKIKGLDLGADDYLAKPFHMAELQSRIKSVLRRRKFEGSAIIQINNLKLIPDDRIVFVNDEELVLNRKEYAILLYLVSNKNRLINKAALAEHVWGDYIDDANNFDFIYSQIKNLRKKLKDSGAGIKLQAVYGLGYKLITE